MAEAGTDYAGAQQAGGSGANHMQSSGRGGRAFHNKHKMQPEPSNVQKQMLPAGRDIMPCSLTIFFLQQQ